MARIAGVDLPKDKRIEIALTYVYGIGRSSARQILEKAGIDLNMRSKDLAESDISKIKQVMDDGFTIEGDLRKEISMNIKRLMDLGCYRGLRHRRGLPCRGQRTKTNARTRKAPKRTCSGKNK